MQQLNNETIKLLLTGGGTGGSVTPLLAVADKFGEKFPQTEFVWLGTENGPEKKLVEERGIKFIAISSGKWRRYFSFKNITDIFLILAGFFKSLKIIQKEKPDIILSAGSFVSVPVVWAGRVLGVPSLIHQQDVAPGLANKLMAPVAKKITLTFLESRKSFPGKKTLVVGNPVRQEIFGGDKNRANKFFNLEDELPTVLIIGGGTGALAINDLIRDSFYELTKFCQIIHLTGGGKRLGEIDNKRYHAYEFLTGAMADALAAADLVVSRAGMGVLTELSLLGKPAIIIPIPDSHQEANAGIFKTKEAAVVLNQRELTADEFIVVIREMLGNKKKLNKLSERIGQVIPAGAAEKVVQEITNIV